MYYLYKIWAYFNNNLGSTSWIPIPQFIKNVFAKYPMQMRILAYARLLKGQRVFYGVPREVGCANAVTGLLEMVDPSFFGRGDTVDRIDSTIKLTEEMERSYRFIELKTPIDGCVVITAKKLDGGILKKRHVGIFDGKRIWNNNSDTGIWSPSYTMQSWLNYFGLETRYFFPLSDK